MLFYRRVKRRSWDSLCYVYFRVFYYLDDVFPLQKTKSISECWHWPVRVSHVFHQRHCLISSGMPGSYEITACHVAQCAALCEGEWGTTQIACRRIISCDISGSFCVLTALGQSWQRPLCPLQYYLHSTSHPCILL